MKSTAALEEFETYLRRAGDGKIPRTARAGVETMTAFYRDVRAEDVDMESDGDMLLFQWGMVDRGDGDMFEVDITRQFIRGGGEDDDIWQLHLTYRFAPTESLRALGNGDRWCERPDQVAALDLFVGAHPAMAATGTRADCSAHLEYECAG
jgi:hypothetical protein